MLHERNAGIEIENNLMEYWGGKPEQADIDHFNRLFSGKKPIAVVPGGRNKRKNYSCTEFCLSKTRSVLIFSGKPIYYVHMNLSLRPMSEIMEWHGNKYMRLRVGWERKMHPTFARWLIRRQRKIGGTVDFPVKIPRFFGSSRSHVYVREKDRILMSQLLADVRGVTAGPYTFNPDKHPEVTSVDGFVRRQDTDAAWVDAHDTNDGTSASDTATDDLFAASRKSGGGNFGIYRGFFLFDVSASIASDDDVVSAILSLYVTAIANGDNDGDDFVSIVVNANPASNTALAVGDYDACGDAEDNPTEGHATSERKDISSVTTSAFLNWTLNSTGMTSIGSSVAKFGCREGHDVQDIAYAGSNNTSNYINGYFSDHNVAGEIPKLVVTIDRPWVTRTQPTTTWTPRTVPS